MLWPRGRCPRAEQHSYYYHLNTFIIIGPTTVQAYQGYADELCIYYRAVLLLFGIWCMYVCMYVCMKVFFLKKKKIETKILKKNHTMKEIYGIYVFMMSDFTSNRQ